MLDVHLGRLLAGQEDLVAWWQLRAIGWSRDQINARVWRDRWRPIHRGVWATHRGELTQRHRWIAAVLTAPGTWLCGPSAAACHGFYEWDGPYETVVRAGSGGPRRFGPLLVARSTALEGHTTRRDGIPLVTAPRALVDLAPGLGVGQLGRGFRESIRVGATTANEISRALAGQRGTRRLAVWCDRYASIPYHRCRSDAEGRALEILHDHGIPAPKVNVKVANIEADLVWREARFLVEVDGREFHMFADEDARKDAAWKAAGYEPLRIPAADVYHRPERLVSIVNVQLARA